MAMNQEPTKTASFSQYWKAVVHLGGIDLKPRELKLFRTILDYSLGPLGRGRQCLRLPTRAILALLAGIESKHLPVEELVRYGMLLVKPTLEGLEFYPVAEPRFWIEKHPDPKAYYRLLSQLQEYWATDQLQMLPAEPGLNDALAEILLGLGSSQTGHEIISPTRAADETSTVLRPDRAPDAACASSVQVEGGNRESASAVQSERVAAAVQAAAAIPAECKQDNPKAATQIRKSWSDYVVEGIEQERKTGVEYVGTAASALAQEVPNLGTQTPNLGTSPLVARTKVPESGTQVPNSGTETAEMGGKGSTQIGYHMHNMFMSSKEHNVMHKVPNSGTESVEENWQSRIPRLLKEGFFVWPVDPPRLWKYLEVADFFVGGKGQAYSALWRKQVRFNNLHLASYFRLFLKEVKDRGPGSIKQSPAAFVYDLMKRDGFHRIWEDK